MSSEATVAAEEGGDLVHARGLPGARGDASAGGGEGADEERERARMRDAAREAHERAVAATRAKSEFLAVMSHEMRTPLNAVLGYTELLALEVPGRINADQRAYLDRIRAASSRLLSLINDVLDLTKIDAGRMVVSHERLEAQPVVRHVLAMVAQQATAAGVRVVSKCDEGASFMGDRRRAEQVLLQLLGNAIRFTARGGKVTLTCTQFGTPDSGAQLGGGHRCWCAIRVEDTGVGIDDSHVTTIFDPFVQVETGHTRSHDGTGLGLAVGRRLARLMGGDLTVSSRLGAGSSFTLWLPAPPLISGDADGVGCATPERRSDARNALGLVTAADAILSDLDALVRRHVRNLRDDDQFAGTTALDDTELLDHTGTFLTDVAQSLCIIEESGGEPSQLMRDGTEIQTLIANRHGIHRQSLGWTEHEIGREYGLLFAEIERTVRGSVRESEQAGVTSALALARRFIERACAESVAAWRRATVGQDAAGPADPADADPER